MPYSAAASRREVEFRRFREEELRCAKFDRRTFSLSKSVVQIGLFA